MILKIFTVFDLKAQAYLPPNTMRSKGEYLRAFADTVNDKKTMLGQHPEDYVAYCIGEFDDASGMVSSYEPHEMLGKAIEFVLEKPKYDL